MVTAVLDLSLCWGSRPQTSKHTEVLWGGPGNNDW